MRKLAYSFAGLILAAGAAHAQPTDVPASDHAAPHADAAGPADAAQPATPAEPATPADPAADAAAIPAEPATPAQAATPAEPATPAQPAGPEIAAADVTDADIDSFAQATVKLQEIQADTTIAADQKQMAMRDAVTSAGLDPAKYNAIGKAAAADATLRTKVQTAMSKYAPETDAAEQPTEG